jgi:hypothetical protein
LLFNPKDNRLWKALENRYSLELVTLKNKPDFLIYSDFGKEHWEFDGLKIYITGENMVPDFMECDLAFTPFEILNEPRAIRLPYYAQILTEPESGQPLCLCLQFVGTMQSIDDQWELIFQLLVCQKSIQMYCPCRSSACWLSSTRRSRGVWGLEVNRVYDQSSGFNFRSMKKCPWPWHGFP